MLLSSDTLLCSALIWHIICSITDKPSYYSCSDTTHSAP